MPVPNNDEPGGEPGRDWQDEIGDLLERADLPEPPASSASFTPDDAELRAAYELELHREFLLDAWRERLDFDLWCLRRYATSGAEKTAAKTSFALRGLYAARRVRRFALEEIDKAAIEEEEEGAKIIAKCREVLGNVDVLEAKIRRLNPEAAAEFDRENP